VGLIKQDRRVILLSRDSGWKLVEVRHFHAIADPVIGVAFRDSWRMDDALGIMARPGDPEELTSVDTLPIRLGLG
jgi:hypothetical protein